MVDKIAIRTFLLLSVVWQVYAEINCTETGAGRFANPDDTTCQNYTLCVYNSATGIWEGYNYVCPANAVFNPSTSICTAATNYVCNVTSTNTTSSLSTGDGFVADPDLTNCTSYINCVQGNSTFIEELISCPDGTYFNPNTTDCEFDYNCTTVTPFTCTKAGRFTDTKDSTCQAYHFCALLSNGTYGLYNYTCPSTSIFNPISKLCTLSSYTCTTT